MFHSHSIMDITFVVSGRIDEDNILVLPFDIEQQPSHEGIVCAAVQHFRKVLWQFYYLY